TGAFVGAEEINAVYWRTHVRQPVEFARGVRTLVAAGFNVFVEVGPAPVLLGMARKFAGEQAAWLPSLRRGRGDRQQILESLGRLYVEGAEIRFDRFPGRKSSLPCYPFEKTRYWYE